MSIIYHRLGNLGHAYVTAVRNADRKDLIPNKHLILQEVTLKKDGIPYNGVLRQKTEQLAWKWAIFAPWQ